jgi:membrane protease YdiL (CAAX protease family)
MPGYPSWFGLVLIVVMLVCEFLFCALPAILWAVIGRQKWTEAFAWRRASGREYIGAALLGLGFIPWVQTEIVLQNHVWPRGMAGQGANNALMLPLIAHYPLLMSLTLPLAAAFCEELFFRGVLQRALLKRLPVAVALGLASLLFAAVHFDLQGFLVRMLLGVLLAVVVLRGRSIFPAMMTHFVYDAAALGSVAWDIHAQGIGKILRLTGSPDMGVSHVELIVGPVVGTVLLAAGWALCASAWRRKRPEVLPESEVVPLENVWPPSPTVSVSSETDIVGCEQSL